VESDVLAQTPSWATRMDRCFMDQNEYQVCKADGEAASSVIRDL